MSNADSQKQSERTQIIHGDRKTVTDSIEYK